MTNSKELYDKRWWALGAICIPLIIVSIDGTILNVALPTIATALHTTSSQLVWINAAYIIIFGSTILLGGSLGDKYGRKWALLIGMIIFGAGSLGAGLSSNPLSLILMRGIMGVGGGLLMPATLSLITNIFPDNERQKAIGTWAGMSGIGVAVGPLAGGVILTYFHWSWVFYVNIPIVIIGLLAISSLVPHSKASNAPPIDLKGALISFFALMSLFYGIIQGPEIGWLNISVIFSFMVSAVLVYLFIKYEKQQKHPLLDINFFRIPEFSSGVISIAISFFALFGLIYMLTQYLQFIQDYTPFQAGLALFPFALVLLYGSPRIPLLVNKFSKRKVVIGGFIIMATGLFLFGIERTSSTYLIVLVGLVMVSLGMTMVQVPASDSIMGSIPRERAGQGSATNAAIRQIGSSFGIAIIGSISQSLYVLKLSGTAALESLPPDLANSALLGIPRAINIGKELGGSGEALIKYASLAFVYGMDISLIITAFIALAGALIAYKYLPK
ncbi:MAG: MFS transporter [Methanobacteriaceae archaeon]